MRSVSVTLIGFTLLVLPFVASGSEESCPVEGITARWAVSYCMTRFETDDEAHNSWPMEPKRTASRTWHTNRQFVQSLSSGSCIANRSLAASRQQKWSLQL
jgi:hypothetical protein